MKRKSTYRTGPKRFRGRPRVPHLESLEGRAVLSVCGVSCDFVDGKLRVDGTAGNDLIELRYDAQKESLSVIGANDELVAQFPLADIRQLDVHGLDGDDVFHVDAAIRVPITLNGGEGEDALVANTASDSHLHQHGTEVSAVLAQNSIEGTVVLGRVNNQNAATAAGQAPPLPLGTVQPVLSAPSATAASGAFIITGTTVQSLDHGSHGSSAAVPLLVEHSHDGATALLAGATSFLLPQHGHAIATVAAVRSATLAEGQNDELPVEHGAHATDVNPVQPQSKLVPKPCTVSRSGGLIVTAVTGKRECGCEAKALAAEEATRQIMGQGGAAVVRGLVTSVNDCLPCQAGGLPSDLLSCSAPMIMGGPTMVLDHLSGDSCPAAEEAAVDAVVAESSPFLGGLQMVGYTLLATGAVLLPSLRQRKAAKDEEREATNVDWLFGRFDIELLMAR